MHQYPPSDPSLARLDHAGAAFVNAVIAVGRHSMRDYVDWKVLPAELQFEAAELGKATTADVEVRKKLREYVTRFEEQLTAIMPDTEAETERHGFLSDHVRALARQVAFLCGEKVTFDQEARDFFRISPPQDALKKFENVRDAVRGIVPQGGGDFYKQAMHWREKHRVPPGRLRNVVRAALREARLRARAHNTDALPPRSRRQITNERPTIKNWLPR